MSTSAGAARAAIEQFLETFDKASTRNQRRTYLLEYLAYLGVYRDCSESELTVSDILDRRNIEAWMTAAGRGATRRRKGMQGPNALAAANSMAARTSTINTFSRFCGTPLALRRPRTNTAKRLTFVEAHRTLRLLAGYQPVSMRTAAWERSVAVVALAVCTRRGLPYLHRMRLRDVELDRALPRVRVLGEWYPIDAFSREILIRWLATRRTLTAGPPAAPHEEGLWITTSPGRIRTGDTVPRTAVRAKLRTLEAAHRKLTIEALGIPVRLEQFCGTDDNNRLTLAPGRPGPQPGQDQTMARPPQHRYQPAPGPSEPQAAPYYRPRTDHGQGSAARPLTRPSPGSAHRTGAAPYTPPGQDLPPENGRPAGTGPGRSTIPADRQGWSPWLAEESLPMPSTPTH